MKIVVIDDEPDFLALIATRLAAAGHEVVTELRATKGIAEVLANGADVLVTDMLMPDFDGLEVIRTLRAKRPQLWIVAISGGGQLISSAMTLNFSQALGADRILYKPFGHRDLLAAIEPCNEAHPAYG